MKKIRLTALFIAILLLLCACSAGVVKDGAKQNEAVETASGDNFSLVGVWTVDSTVEGESADFVKMALKSVLRQNVKSGMEIEFKDDNTASVGDIEIGYELEGEKLTLIWDKTKNFKFDLSGNNTEITIAMDGVMTAVLKRK